MKRVELADVAAPRAWGDHHDRLFLVLPRCEGRSLSGWIAGHRKARTRPAIATAQRIFDRVAGALDGARQEGSAAPIHGALSPRSVLMRREGPGRYALSVLDFGIAQLTDERVTPVMEFIGTPLYMPPEAYGGSGLVDAHADVWALGVMLYETLAGEHPFAPAHDTPMGCMEAVLYRAPPSLAALGVVPPSVWMALRRAIAKPLAQRYSSAGELLAALDAAMRPVRMLRVNASTTLEQARAALLREDRFRFQYTRSDGSPWTLTLAELLDRADQLEAAYNPNDCPELRWGAAEGSPEASTCRRRSPAEQQAKMQRYRGWFHDRKRPARGT